MKTKRFAIAMFSAAIAACLCATLALASGGIYLGDLRITNDGKPVLMDDFRTDKLSSGRACQARR